MKIGANYTPSQGWFHSWLDLDIDATRRDFEGIAQLGLDHVRLFPLWPLLQPNRGLVRPRALDDVVSVVRAAGEFDLEVTVDALNGHLSSYDFLPSWVITWHTSNLFTDPLVKAGQTRPHQPTGNSPAGGAERHRHDGGQRVPAVRSSGPGPSSSDAQRVHRR